MKKYIYLFLFLSGQAFAQRDSLDLQKVRFEFLIPFEGGVTIGGGTKTAALPEHAEILMNNNKFYGAQFQTLASVCFFNKLSLEAGYSADHLGCNNKKVISEFENSNNNYFVQAEAKSKSLSYGQYYLGYFRLGVSWNFKISKSRSIQPYVYYAMGKGKLPAAKFAYKDRLSNNFYTNDYSFNSIKSMGYIVGIRLKRFSDFDQPAECKSFGYAGIKIEFAYMGIKGVGQVLHVDGISSEESLSAFDVVKHYSYFTIGVYAGIGNKKYRTRYFD